MTHNQPIITESRVAAFIAAALRLLGWLLLVILRGGWSGRGARLKRALSFMERGVERILLVKAMSLYGPPPSLRRHPRGAPRGFRRVAGDLRLFFKLAKVRARKAGALARVIALIEALAQPGRAVAYFLKRLCKGLCLARLAPFAPPADALMGDPARETAFADSS